MMIEKIDDLTKKNIIGDKIGVEGGYVDNENDLGGKTCQGITERVARKYEAQLVEYFSWNGEMRSLTSAMAFYIYEKEYWAPLKLDRMVEDYPVVADQMFDLGINAGPMIPVKHLQEYLNVNNNQGKHYPDLVVDGLIGSKTFRALDVYIGKRGDTGMYRLMIGLLSLQAAYYIRISIAREKNEEFTYGWIGRVQHHIDRYKRLIEE